VVLTTIKSVVLLGLVVGWLRPEFVLDVIDIPNVPKSSPVNKISIQAAVRMSLAGYSLLQVSTVAFHRE